VRNRQASARRARRIERQVKAGDQARVHVEHQGQPRPSDAGARDVVDQHDVNLGVVDLHDLQRPFRP
jgi:hypothetical protein